MNKITKIIMFLIIGIIIPCLAACGGTDEEFSIDYDIDLNNKIDLNILMPNSGYTIDEVNNDKNALLIEDLTGYKVNYKQLPAADSSKTLNNELLDKIPYDAIKLTKNQFSDLVKDDMLVDITEALKIYGKDLLANISSESWDVVTVDGKIYGIPERASSDNIENPIIFNQDLLLQENLAIPTTLSEFENVLKVLTEKIGKPALTFDRYTQLIYAISAAFGIYSDWGEYTVNGKTEVLYYMNAPRYQEYMEYMHNLYKKGYIDVTVATNSASDALNRFTTGNAACVACSLWSVTAIISSLKATNKISEVEASSTLENYLGYLRALKEKASDPEKVYRASGYTYIVAIPFYQAKNTGYALDWMNSKVIDNDTKRNFRSIVIGSENVHWTYSQSEGYLPITANFMEKDNAHYYLTGTNELKYTEYWKARVRKQPEMYRAWSILMNDCNEVGVYNIVDFTPPIEKYNSNRSFFEEYAQDQFYIMLKDGLGNISDYLSKLNGQQKCSIATDAINEWYGDYSKKNK